MGAGDPDAEAEDDGDRAIVLGQALLDQVRPRTPAAQARVDLASGSWSRSVKLDDRLVQPIGQKSPDVGAGIWRLQPQVVCRQRPLAVEDADLDQVRVRLARHVALHGRDRDPKHVRADADALVDGWLRQIGQRRRPRATLG